MFNRINSLNQRMNVKSGACYAISRGALRKLVTVFEKESFFHREREVSRLWYCMHRRGQFEVLSLCRKSVCRSLSWYLNSKIVVKVFSSSLLSFVMSSIGSLNGCLSTIYWNQSDQYFGSKISTEIQSIYTAIS